VRKVEKVVRAKVSGLGDVAGRRDSGVYIATRSQLSTLSRVTATRDGISLTSAGRVRIVFIIGARPHCSRSLPC
jgi:hypothetical protein